MKFESWISQHNPADIFTQPNIERVARSVKLWIHSYGWIIVVCLAVFIFFRLKKNFGFGTRKIKKDFNGFFSGIVFGKLKAKYVYSDIDDEGHVGVFSATGTGKTSAVCIPTLRTWEGSSFVIDISGDISQNCPMPNKLIYEPENLNTTPYNIFYRVDSMPTKEQKDQELAALALLLIPKPLQQSDTSRFYTDNGREILTAALIAFYHQGMDFHAICEKILTSGWQQLFHDILLTQDPAAAKHINSFKGIEGGGAASNAQGCKQTVDTALSLFASTQTMQSIRRPHEGEACITPPMLENHNIFIVVPDHLLELYAPMLNIITAQMMQYISMRQKKRGQNKILLMLDEFSSLGLDDTTVIQALQKYRKRNCRIVIMTQNLADLRRLYGENSTRSIIGNLQFQVLLGGLNEPESQRYFADKIGMHEIQRQSRTHSSTEYSYSNSRTSSTVKEYRISPEDLDRQGDNKCILIHPDLREGFIVLNKAYYFNSLSERMGRLRKLVRKGTA